jgi:hypothetical protein
MSQTIRQQRDIRAIDPSNQTLRFNRSRQEAGMYGDIDDDAPTGAAIAWGLACALVFGVTLLAWWAA